MDLFVNVSGSSISVPVTASYAMNVEVGLRVVRGPDWKWGSQDGGEGFVGTVVEIGRSGASSPDETVIVRWDSGTKTNYRVGYQDAYDLRVIDNAPVGVKHMNIVCDGCKKRGIIGIRWRCSTCEDYDLCTPCYMSDKHDVKHNFIRYDNATSRGVDVGKRKDCQRVLMQGIFVGAKVQRGPDWDWGNQDGGKGKIGRVVDIRGWDGESGRSVANVIWASGITNVYRVGHKGKVDLTVATPGKNGYFYPEHLPVLGKKEPVEEEGATSSRTILGATAAVPTTPQLANAAPACGSSTGSTPRFTVGEKVTITPDVNRLKALADGHGGWNPKMAECVGKIGVVHRITDRGDVRVQFGGRDKWTFHPLALSRAPHEFSIGDVVRVIDDRALAMELQRGHGEWAETMCDALGKVGRVLKVYPDRDLRVCVDGSTWTFNPQCLSLVPGSAMELFNSMGSNHHQRDESEHQNPLPSVSSYLDGALARSESSTAAPAAPGTAAVSASVALSAVEARLSRAAVEGDLRGLAELLRKFPDGANARINGKTILQVSCHQGHLDVVSVLLPGNGRTSPASQSTQAAGVVPVGVRANIELADEEGDTPLHYAAFGNQPEVMELLVQRGANMNVVNKAHCTPLHVVVNKQFAACTRVLLRHGADVNVQDSYGDTALHDAIGKDSGEILVMLASVPGCDFSLKNNRGFNALHHAALKGNNLAVEKILERSRQLVDVRKDDGFTALHLAALNGHVLIARTLFCLGHCRLDAKTNRGQTALMLAAAHAHASVVDLLVRADGTGATLAAVDDDGDTAMHMALLKSQGSLTPLANPSSLQSAVAAGSVHEIWQELSRGGGGPEMAAMAIACFLASRGAPHHVRNRTGKTPLDLITSPLWKAKVLLYARLAEDSDQAAPDAGSSASSVEGAAAPVTVDGAAVEEAPDTSASVTSAAPPLAVLADGTECVVCCEPSSKVGTLVRFLPCGHVIACRVCTVRMKKCLKCGRMIAAKVGSGESSSRRK